MARGEKPGEQVALLKEIADTLIRMEGELVRLRVAAEGRQVPAHLLKDLPAGPAKDR